MEVNGKIKDCMYSCRVKAYEMPRILGVSESSYYRKMRNEMPSDEQKAIIQKIKEYAKERSISDGKR